MVFFNWEPKGWGRKVAPSVSLGTAPLAKSVKCVRSLRHLRLFCLKVGSLHLWLWSHSFAKMASKSRLLRARCFLGCWLPQPPTRYFYTWERREIAGPLLVGNPRVAATRSTILERHLGLTSRAQQEISKIWCGPDAFGLPRMEVCSNVARVQIKGCSLEQSLLAIICQRKA